jgi:hypothetical protein
MRPLIAVWVVICGCKTSVTEEPPPTARPHPTLLRLEQACASHVCPADPPKSVDCMPIAGKPLALFCGSACRTFLEQSCHISFLE